MWAPLIPKLRGYFAEFLSQSSLTRLSILNSPTCVRLRYEHSIINTTRFFLEVWDQSLYGAEMPLVLTSRGYEETDLPISSPYELEPGNPSPG